LDNAGGSGKCGREAQKKALKAEFPQLPPQKKAILSLVCLKYKQKKIVTLFGLKYKQWLTISIIFDAIIP
jgi:hypothetical protein